MKLTTDRQKIEELYKLDGWTPFQVSKDYLNSYDDIIPLIQKQDRLLVGQVILDLKNGVHKVPHYMATPLQLANALLIAKGFEV